MNVEELVSKMTLEEKAALCSGKDFWHTKAIERLHIPSVMVSDGPHGLRKQKKSSEPGSVVGVCFPSASGAACSFDRAMLYSLGSTLGNECQAEQVAILLGPAVNIKRSPLCGRNFEYFSEDPCLAGELAAHYIRGVQSQNVGTCIKHFAANNQEYKRATISSVADERTLQEIYLPAFENAVKNAQPWTVMCSYNKINGIHASENEWLLTENLRTRWGFDGFVMTDWGAVNDRVKGIRAGLDLEMPGSGGVNDRKIVQAVQNGTLSEDVLDRSVKRILNIVFRFTENQNPSAVFDREKDHEKARKTALSSMVLLKNNGILPLKKGENIAFIGKFAKEPRYQGGGSSHITPYKVVGALQAAGSIPGICYAQGYDTKKDEILPELLEEAVTTAAAVQTAVIFAGLPDDFESEGYDRTHLRIPRCQQTLIEEVSKVQKNLVVVLHNGSPIEMPWLDKAGAVLESYLGGEAVGEAQAALLFGDENPSGKLAETFPLRLEDTPCFGHFPGNPMTVEYREGIYVGYRYYEKQNIPVLFPFGHGLSYTTFAYSNLTLEMSTEGVIASCTVQNTGERAGGEILQCYVSPPKGAVFKAAKELRGFEKVCLEPREKAEVSFLLNDRAFSHFDTSDMDWRIEDGAYEIQIGASSRDIRLRGKVNRQGTLTLPPAESPAHYWNGDVHHVTDQEFETLLSHPVPPAQRLPGAPFTRDDTMGDAEHTGWGKFFLWCVRRAISKMGIGSQEMLMEFFKGTPMRGYVTGSGGRLSDEFVDGILLLLNGKNPVSGLWHMFHGALFKSG